MIYNITLTEVSLSSDITVHDLYHLYCYGIVMVNISLNHALKGIRKIDSILIFTPITLSLNLSQLK